MLKIEIDVTELRQYIIVRGQLALSLHSLIRIDCNIDSISILQMQYFRVFLHGDIEIMKGFLRPINFVKHTLNNFVAVALNAITFMFGGKILRISFSLSIEERNVVPLNKITKVI